MSPSAKVLQMLDGQGSDIQGVSMHQQIQWLGTRQIRFSCTSSWTVSYMTAVPYHTWHLAVPYHT
jgi:hypothetical protein